MNQTACCLDDGEKATGSLFFAMSQAIGTRSLGPNAYPSYLLKAYTKMIA